MQLHDFKPEADDPQHEPPQGGLVWQFGAEGRRSRTCGQRAVIKCRAQRVARAADEGDLIGAGSEPRDVGRVNPPPVQDRCRPGIWVSLCARDGTRQATARGLRTGWLVNRDAIVLLVMAVV